MDLLFSFLNPCESVFIRGSSFFLFLFLLHPMSCIMERRRRRNGIDTSGWI